MYGHYLLPGHGNDYDRRIANTIRIGDKHRSPEILIRLVHQAQVLPHLQDWAKKTPPQHHGQQQQHLEDHLTGGQPQHYGQQQQHFEDHLASGPPHHLLLFVFPTLRFLALLQVFLKRNFFIGHQLGWQLLSFSNSQMMKKFASMIITSHRDMWALIPRMQDSCWPEAWARRFVSPPESRSARLSSHL